jgi:hypothetical protein
MMDTAGAVSRSREKTLRTIPTLPPFRAIAPAALLAACAGDGTAGRFASVRDSAGISIVESTAPAWREPRWTVEQAAAVDIGAADDPDQELFRVRGAVRLSDGRIVIADGGSTRLRFYDAAGVHLVDAGRRGSGPGEFRYIGELVRLAGDSVLVLNGLERLHIYDADGALAREHALDVRGTIEPPFFTEYARPLADGTLLVHLIEPSRDRPPGIFRPLDGYIRFDPKLGGRDTIGFFPALEHEQVGGDAKWMGYAATSALALGHDRLAVGDTKVFDIGVYRFDGTLERRIRAPVEQQPVTDADRAAFEAFFLDRIRADPMQAPRISTYEQILAELPYPETKPVFESIVLDPAGNLWVKDFDPFSGGPSFWRVFDPDGRWLGTLEMPAGLRVREIGDDYVLGTATDELDVEHVRLHRLVKR